MYEQFLKKRHQPGVVAQAFIPSNQETEAEKNKSPGLA